jgi:uncharacterized protein YecE (DUF72 family)
MTLVVDLYIGTSGWTYASWRGRVYPQGVPRRSWLAYYAGLFPSVEVNGSFYGLPQASTFQSWASQVPEDFRFAVKGSRHVTHFKKLVDTEDSVELFLDRARELGPKLGPLLWQLPGSLRFDLGRLDAFVATLPRGLTHVLEARHPSWKDDRARQALADANIALACWDLLGETWVEEPTAPHCYLRFHGSTRKYGGTYSTEELRPWAELMERWLADGHVCWAFFNNDLDGYAVENARQLRTMLDSQSHAGSAHHVR